MPEVLSGEAEALDDYVTEDANQIVLHLCKNVFPLELDKVVLADLVECTFPGYAAQRLVDWIDVPGDDEDLAESISEFVEFTAGVIVDPELCTGVYVTLKEGVEAARLLDLQIFDIPLLFSAEGQILRRRYRMFSLNNVA